MIRFLKWTAFLAVAAIVGCDNGVNTGSAEKVDKPETAVVKEEPKPEAAEPTKKLEFNLDAQMLADRKNVKITDTKVGSGAVAEIGDQVFMTYTGTLVNSSTPFDSNDKPDGSPLPVTLGAGGVIRGWDVGLPGMKVGGERRLEIPPALGYGEQGSGKAIPPNSTLVFTVKLLDVVKAADAAIFDITIMKPGTGPKVQKGDKIALHYVAKLANGRVVDSSLASKTPLVFTVGKGEVVAGFDAGVVGMQPGEKRTLRLPPTIAYGAQGRPGKIDGPQVLTFELELVRIEK